MSLSARQGLRSGARTCHGGVDSTYVCEQRDLGELDGEGGGVVHLVAHNLGALGRVVERVYIEVAEVDAGGRLAGRFVGKDASAVGEEVMEEVVLDVFSGKGLRIAAFDGQCLARDILGSGGDERRTWGRGGRLTGRPAGEWTDP